jgi:hypothetical protein
MTAKHFEGILVPKIRGMTTAFTERLNNLFFADVRNVRGGWSANSITTMLYIVASKLALPSFLPIEQSGESDCSQKLKIK